MLGRAAKPTIPALLRARSARSMWRFACLLASCSAAGQRGKLITRYTANMSGAAMVSRLLKNAFRRQEMTKNEDHKIRNALNLFVANFSAHAFVRSKIKFQQPANPSLRSTSLRSRGSAHFCYQGTHALPAQGNRGKSEPRAASSGLRRSLFGALETACYTSGSKGDLTV